MKRHILITNFHLPESTLIMLVSALAGRENVLNAYKTAVQFVLSYSYSNTATYVVNGFTESFSENFKKITKTRK